LIDNARKASAEEKKTTRTDARRTEREQEKPAAQKTRQEKPLALEKQQGKKTTDTDREEALQRLKEEAEMEKAQREARAREDKINKHINRCKRYLADGRYNLAMEEYKKVQKLDPQRAVDIDELIKESRLTQQKKEASRHLEKAKSYYSNAKYSMAERELERTLDLDPDNIEADRLLKQCQRRMHPAAEYYKPTVKPSVSAAAPTGVAAASLATESASGSLGTSQPTAAQPAEQETPEEIQKRISREVQKEQVSSGTTMADVEKKYQVVGVVAYRSEANDIAALNEELLKKAKMMGAEEVIQVRYFQYNNYIYGYGTAVKKKK